MKTKQEMELEERKVMALERIAVCLERLTVASFISPFEESWEINEEYIKEKEND